MYPEDLRYTEEHEWVRPAGNRAVVGITHYAQEQLGDVVFVEVPEVGRELRAGEPFGAVESVKSVSYVYAPVSGRVVAVNELLADSPELVNRDPYGRGWLIEVEMADPEELAGLLTAEQYSALVE